MTADEDVMGWVLFIAGGAFVGVGIGMFTVSVIRIELNRDLSRSDKG